jgi:hypothetical protein
MIPSLIVTSELAARLVAVGVAVAVPVRSGVTRASAIES